jgi:tetraacyldisaccharide 4'-kinase
VSWLLKPAELLYRAINRMRRVLYRAGVLRARRLPVPVISVGNIAVGGGGKTPTVIAIARILARKGVRVGVLTRGYGRAGAGGEVTELDAARFGDEPVLIKKSIQNVTVIVGANRYQNALRHQCDVYLLDDGFQHLQLHRDLDIVLDDPHARYLREGRSALRHADIVLQRDVRPIVPSSLRGKRVFAFAGLADNDQFFASLRDAGVKLVATRSFPDHHRYANIESIKRDAADVKADAIVTTEKDAVKLNDEEIVAIPAETTLPPEAIARILAVVRQ